VQGVDPTRKRLQALEALVGRLAEMDRLEDADLKTVIQLVLRERKRLRKLLDLQEWRQRRRAELLAEMAAAEAAAGPPSQIPAGLESSLVARPPVLVREE
jgi:hypothetical protein